MKEFVKELFWGLDGKPSLTKIMAFMAVLYFFLVTGYLVLEKQSWEHYEVFAILTCGGGLSTKLGDKYINNK